MIVNRQVSNMVLLACAAGLGQSCSGRGAPAPPKRFVTLHSLPIAPSAERSHRLPASPARCASIVQVAVSGGMACPGQRAPDAPAAAEKWQPAALTTPLVGAICEARCVHTEAKASQPVVEWRLEVPPGFVGSVVCALEPLGSLDVTFVTGTTALHEPVGLTWMLPAEDRPARFQVKGSVADLEDYAAGQRTRHGIVGLPEDELEANGFCREQPTRSPG